MKKRKQKKGSLGLVSEINEQEAGEKLIRILNANFKEDEIEIHLVRNRKT